MAVSRPASRRRGERAKKPLSVPFVTALIGAAIFFLGIAVASVDVSALGALLSIWGILSFSVLVLVRWRRARKRVRAIGAHSAPPRRA
jgi:hypothetical protein